MLVNKITSGFVIQVFDTELQRFISQEFVAGEDCQYEDEDGVSVSSEVLEVDGEEAYLPFDMVQPTSHIKERYEDGICPDCGLCIPYDAREGGACVNCGHVWNPIAPCDDDDIG